MRGSHSELAMAANFTTGSRSLAGIEAIILGGTDLSPLFRDGGSLPLPILDPTAIHVEAAIAWLLGG